VASAVALTCGYLILAPKIRGPVLSIVDYVEKGSEFVTALTLIGVVLLVVAGKASFGKGQVLRGGMPSGHSAVAFSVATAVTFLSGNFLIMMLTLLLAIMVAQSRLVFRIHTVREVLVGAALGVLFTVLVFQLLR
jgi:diacylglycerol kinase (ATP)